MTRIGLTILALLALLALLSPPAGAQRGGKLKKLIDTAVVANPDVVLAAAKVREAEAELSQVRLRVTQQIVTLYNERKALHHRIETKRIRLDEHHKLVERGVASMSDRAGLIADLAEAESNLASIEARLAYTTGGGERTSSAARGFDVDSAPAVRRPPPSPSDAARLKALVELAPSGDSWLDTIAGLRRQVPGLALLVDPALVDDIGIDFTIEARLPGKRGLGEALAALSDLHGWAFVLRDYGILMTSRRRAEQLYAPTVPADVPLDPKVRPPAKSEGGSRTK